VLLAAFFVQAYPSAPALDKTVTHLYLEHGVNAREAIHHYCDEGAVPQPDECGLRGFRLATAPPRVPYERNAVKQLAGFFGHEHERLAFSHDVFGIAHGVGRIHVDDVADHQPVEQHAQRSQVLLDFRAVRIKGSVASVRARSLRQQRSQPISLNIDVQRAQLIPINRAADGNTSLLTVA
jgi:hypothetical protein